MLIDSLSAAIRASKYVDSPFRLRKYRKTYHDPFDRVETRYLRNLEKLDNGLLTQLYRKTAEDYSYNLTEFVSHIIEDFENKGWVDLEGIYFSLLVRLVSQKDFDRAKVITLNEQMEGLRKSLCQYLHRIAPPKPSKDIQAHLEQIRDLSIERIQDQFSQNLKKYITRTRSKETRLEEGEIQAYLGATKEPSSITVLTFNYTNTCAALYKDALTIQAREIPNILTAEWIQEELPPTFIHIHGSLKDDDIVLGYGDETTDKFRELEDTNDNELTKYFKSFYYMQSTHYRQLFEVLEKGAFRLHLMGHSCGLSDRVLLSSIFNHPNLKDVRICYHDRGKDDNDYFELCQNISRHFHDKHAMRLKILPCKGKGSNMTSVPLIPSTLLTRPRTESIAPNLSSPEARLSLMGRKVAPRTVAPNRHKKLD